MNVKLRQMWGSPFHPLLLLSCAHLDPVTISQTKFAPSREQELTSRNISRSQIIQEECVKPESIRAWSSKVCESSSWLWAYPGIHSSSHWDYSVGHHVSSSFPGPPHQKQSYRARRFSCTTYSYFLVQLHLKLRCQCGSGSGLQDGSRGKKP